MAITLPKKTSGEMGIKVGDTVSVIPLLEKGEFIVKTGNRPLSEINILTDVLIKKYKGLLDSLADK